MCVCVCVKAAMPTCQFFVLLVFFPLRFLFLLLFFFFFALGLVLLDILSLSLSLSLCWESFFFPITPSVRLLAVLLITHGVCECKRRASLAATLAGGTLCLTPPTAPLPRARLTCALTHCFSIRVFGYPAVRAKKAAAEEEEREPGRGARGIPGAGVERSCLRGMQGRGVQVFSRTGPYP